MSSSKNDVSRIPKLESDNISANQAYISHDYNPLFVDLWHDIEAELGGLVKSLEQAYYQWQTSLNLGLNPAQSNAEWHSFLSRFRSEIEFLNTRVHDFNHQVPLSEMQKSPYIADAIITNLSSQAG